MLRVTTQWTGFVGAPGYTNHYFGEGFDAATHTQIEANNIAARVRAFWLALAASLPSVVNLQVSPSVVQINPQTGALESEFTATTAGAAVIGSGGSGYSAPSGACITWRTSTILDGKKVRGRSYIVPLQSGTYDAVGTLTAGTQTMLQTAGEGLRGTTFTGGEALVVWHRPKAAQPGGVGKVTAVTVTDKAAVLRSRRD